MISVALAVIFDAVNGSGDDAPLLQRYSRCVMDFVMVIAPKGPRSKQSSFTTGCRFFGTAPAKVRQGAASGCTCWASSAQFPETQVRDGLRIDPPC